MTDSSAAETAPCPGPPRHRRALPMYVGWKAGTAWPRMLQDRPEDRLLEIAHAR